MAGTEVATPALMSHQKDEHDIWVCKDCGWKYPNARPSPKIRKHHKKICPGKAGANPHAAGGSSDDASGDEHHHQHHSVSGSVDAPVPPVESKSRDFDLSSAASAKEDLSSVAAPVVSGNVEEAPAPKAAPSPAAVPVEASYGGLMPHQKDEHDIWTCKACGWKYPNAKPSPKIRKHHKKQCPGKGEAVAAGGSSDEASDDEHHHHHHHPIPPPAAAVEPSQQEAAEAPAEVPTNISREMNFSALKESSVPVVNDETPAAAMEGDAGKGIGDLSLASEPAGAEKAVPHEAKVSEAPVVSGLMAHQKDEHDVWVCKDCGWKYPNAKPSPKIRNHHKKKCPGKAGGGAAKTGGSSDEPSDDEHRSPAVVETGKEDPADAPEVPGSLSEAMDFGALKEASTPVVENENTPTSTLETTPPAAVSWKDVLNKETDKDEKVAPATTESGGLMLHQKDESDVWVCKECGWKYPNAKPSAKVRKNHKKKCPKASGVAKGTDGGSSDGASSEDGGKHKGTLGRE